MSKRPLQFIFISCHLLARETFLFSRSLVLYFLELYQRPASVRSLEFRKYLNNKITMEVNNQNHLYSKILHYQCNETREKKKPSQIIIFLFSYLFSSFSVELSSLLRINSLSTEDVVRCFLIMSPSSTSWIFLAGGRNLLW